MRVTCFRSVSKTVDDFNGKFSRPNSEHKPCARSVFQIALDLQELCYGLGVPKDCALSKSLQTASCSDVKGL